MKNERGIALLEFSYTAPLLLLFIISIVDLGRALNFYMHLTRLSYEAARFASALPALESGECITPLSNINCSRPLHELVAKRVPPLLQGTPVNLETTQVRSTVYSATNPFPDATVFGQEEIVEVVVSATFEPIFRPLSFLTRMSARTVAPHARVGLS